MISAHTVKNEDEVDGINIHPGLLYPVNALDPKYSEGFERKGIKDRKLLFSFIGAYKPHYMNDIRLKLKEFENNPDGLIEIKDEWHFNDAVYKGQVRAERSISEKVNVSILQDITISYLIVFSHYVRLVQGLIQLGSGKH